MPLTPSARPAQHKGASMHQLSEQLTTVRRDAIRRAAYVLADSGLMDGWKAIERALLSRYGSAEMQCFFSSPFCRMHLNQRCAAARTRLRG
jgi:hypothetical protein